MLNKQNSTPFVCAFPRSLSSLITDTYIRSILSPFKFFEINITFTMSCVTFASRRCLSKILFHVIIV